MTDHDDIARLDAHAKKIGAPTLSAALAEFQRIRDMPPLQRTPRDRARLREMDRLARKVEGEMITEDRKEPRHAPREVCEFWVKVGAFALCFILAMSFLELARWWLQ